MCRAIREVQKGKTFFSASVSKRLDRLDRQPSAVAGPRGKSTTKAVQLTSREMEVLQLIAEGKANKETASELGISAKTVEKHREQIPDGEAGHPRHRRGLTRYAIEAGIIESSVQVTIV